MVFEVEGHVDGEGGGPGAVRSKSEKVAPTWQRILLGLPISYPCAASTVTVPAVIVPGSIPFFTR